ncbi:MAG: hypothetical protein NC300_05395 [Bacteroidales bacterium]|nr:hypothetical protein [Clostridium sp.]MCM1203557.1 hypothetical protein [Bacteroidales bacterium]
MIKIKYDKKDKKRYGKAAVVFSALTAADCLILYREGIMQYIPDEMAAVFICAVFPLGMLAAGLWVGYTDAVFYLKRLRKYGYEVPVDKRDFQRDLEKLPGTGNGLKDASAKNHGSIALTAITGMIVIALIIYDAYFLYQYSRLGETIWLFAGALAFATLIWLCHGLFYACQISNRKYKDDVEIDYCRKNRRNLIDGLVEIAVLAVFTFSFLAIINNAAQYMLKAREGLI